MNSRSNFESNVKLSNLCTLKERLSIFIWLLPLKQFKMTHKPFPPSRRQRKLDSVPVPVLVCIVWNSCPQILVPLVANICLVFYQECPMEPKQFDPWWTQLLIRFIFGGIDAGNCSVFKFKMKGLPPILFASTRVFVPLTHSLFPDQLCSAQTWPVGLLPV